MTRCCEISTGDMRTRVLFQTPTDTPDGAGGFTTTWSDLGYFWCRVKVNTSQEKIEGGGLRAVTTYKLVTRHTTLLTLTGAPQLRAQLQGRWCNVKSCDDVELRGRYLEITAVGGVES